MNTETVQTLRFYVLFSIYLFELVPDQSKIDLFWAQAGMSFGVNCFPSLFNLMVFFAEKSGQGWLFQYSCASRRPSKRKDGRGKLQRECIGVEKTWLTDCTV